MNRFFTLTLSLLLLLSCTACVGRAAAPLEEPPQTEPLEAAAPIEEPETPTEPEPVQEPEKTEEPEEPYVRIIDPAKPMVALTFDDGPDGTYSDQILDILEENHALATFFEVGRNVRACPEPVKRMAEMGCEVASHSNAHKNLSKLKKATLLKDLALADEAFTAAGVDAPAMVRPPYGAVNKTVKTATGRAVITWTVDTEDWKSRNAQTVADYVKNYGDLDGEIILMHSIYKSTADATAILVPWLQEQGYQLVTVTELMAFYYGELPQPDHFYGYTYFTTHGRTDTPIELPSMFPPAGEPVEEEAPSAAPEETPAESIALDGTPQNEPVKSPEPDQKTPEEGTAEKPKPAVPKVSVTISPEQRPIEPKQTAVQPREKNASVSILPDPAHFHS